MEDRLYEDLTDIIKIQTVLQDYLDDYNMTFSKEVKLVFFQDAIEHVSRCVSKDRAADASRSRPLLEVTVVMVSPQDCPDDSPGER